MSDLKIGPLKFIDRAGRAVHDVISYTEAAQMPVSLGEVRLEPDPRIAELEAKLERVRKMVKKNRWLIDGLDILKALEADDET